MSLPGPRAQLRWPLRRKLAHQLWKGRPFQCPFSALPDKASTDIEPAGKGEGFTESGASIRAGDVCGDERQCMDNQQRSEYILCV